MKQQEQQINKCSKRRKRTARAAMSCLMLLLLYGCANQRQASPAVTVMSGSDAAGEEVSGQESVNGSDRAKSKEETSGYSGINDAMSDADRTAEPDGRNDARSVTDSGENGEASREMQMLTVYVCGAVANPGVYELPPESRVYEAVSLAGGMTDEAAHAAVNQAGLLTDGQMIEIPTEEEMRERDAGEGEHSDGLVNINTAGLEELKTLPGIGDSKARSIIAYREGHGAFATIEEIKQIEGIKDGVFAKLEGCIKVD